MKTSFYIYFSVAMAIFSMAYGNVESASSFVAAGFVIHALEKIKD